MRAPKFQLTPQGAFVSDAEEHEEHDNWTRVPPPQPMYSPTFTGTRNASTGEWTGAWTDVEPPVYQPTTKELCDAVDAAADRARRAVVGDPVRATEYERAAAEAQAFKDAGYPANNVPRTVSAWAINGRTAQQAAYSILAESAAYTEALYMLRETRLAAKEDIRQAMLANDTALAKQISDATVSAIQQAVSGLGNNS